MQSVTKKYWIMCVCILALISCDDFFHPGIETTLSERDSFTNVFSTRAAVNGLYALMQDMMTAYVVQGELRGNLISVTPHAHPDLRAIYEMDYDPENPFFAINNAYQIISSAENVLFYLDSLTETGTSYDLELRQMRAETIMVRAWVYFYLLRTFENVPVMNHELQMENGSENTNKSINSGNLHMLHITELIRDVEQIIGDFDPDGALRTAPATNTHFFNVASANAFLGEMYLWNNQYEACITALQRAVETGGGWRFILDPELENTLWRNIFRGDDSATDEIMTKIVFSKGDKQENELLHLFSSNSPGGRHLTPVDWIIESIGNSLRRPGTFSATNEVRKYTRSIDEPFISDMPVILYRAADVHLMMAEAYNRMGHVGLALEIINNGNDSLFTIFNRGVRGRVSLPPLSIQASNLEDSILLMENLIMEERARELAFEGKRWFDMLRIASRRGNGSYIVDLMRYKYKEEEMDRVEQFYNDPQNWYVSF